MRRQAPRPLDDALSAVAHQARPASLLALVQAGWDEAVGPTIAAQSAAVAERAGSVTVACTSAVWAQELELLEPELRDQLNAAVGDRGTGPIGRLRFRVGRLP